MAEIELPSTSPTLLRLLAIPGSDEAWRVFLERYGPMIESRCRRAGLQPADAEDIRATVCAQLIDSLRGFSYDPALRFRGYLYRVVENAIRSQWRMLTRRPGWVGAGGDGQSPPPELLATLGSELDDQIRARIDGLMRTIDRIRFEVGPDAWKAFTLTAIDGLSGPEAASRLGKSVAAVYMAKSRVLAKLRAEAGIADED